MFCVLCWKLSLTLYLNWELRKYLFSKLCDTLETAVEFELDYMRGLYLTCDIC